MRQARKQVAGRLRGLLSYSRCVGFVMILLGAVARFIHFDVAHFQLDQAMLARISWDLAREGIFPTHMWHLSGGYVNFPLASYLHAPIYLIFSDVRALMIWNIVLNLGALSLCFAFARRYWGWQAAVISTLLLATAPWDVFYAHRLWTNAMMPFFVMLWATGAALAHHERRAGWWLPCWMAALWLVQLHPSGIMFPVATCLLCLAQLLGERRLAWKPVALGWSFGALPALPWLAAHLSGEVAVLHDRIPFLDAGRRSFVYNWNLLVDFLAGRNLIKWFQGEGLEHLQQHFAPLDAAAPIFIAALVLSGAIVLVKALKSSDRRLYRMLALWLLLPLAYPAVTFYYSQTMVYFLPMLPAPFIAVGAAFAMLPSRLRLACAGLAFAFCVLNLNAIWQSAAFVRGGVEREDTEIWAVGGGAPLNSQLHIARSADAAIRNGLAREVIVLTKPVKTLEDEHLFHALPVLATDLPIRYLDARSPNHIFPVEDSLLLVDELQLQLPSAYAESRLIARSTRFRLYYLPAELRPSPRIALPGNPAYQNGLRLLGHDGLNCAGGGGATLLAAKRSPSRSPKFVFLLPFA